MLAGGRAVSFGKADRVTNLSRSLDDCRHVGSVLLSDSLEELRKKSSTKGTMQRETRRLDIDSGKRKVIGPGQYDIVDYRDLG